MHLAATKSKHLAPRINVFKIFDDLINDRDSFRRCETFLPKYVRPHKKPVGFQLVVESRLL